MPHSFKIPIEINQKRVDDEAGFRDLSLRYTLKDAPAGQPVTRGRLIAEPVIDLNDYSFEAGIDWIAVQVSLVSWTSWRELRTIIKPAVQCAGKGGVFVFGPKWEENYSGTDFIIRMNDPTQERIHKMLLALWSKLQAPRTFMPKHRVVGLEVFVDVYPKKRDDDTPRDLWARRAVMSDVLRKHVILDGEWLKHEDFGEKDDWPRFVETLQKPGMTKAEKKTQKLIRPKPGTPPDLSKKMDEIRWWARDVKQHSAVPLSATMYIGGKSRTLMIRLQDKVQDQRKGETAIDLEPSQRRSRIEIQMKNSEELNILGGLKIERVEDLRTFEFKKLRKAFFGFQLPTMERAATGAPKEEEVEVMKRSGSLGLDLYQRGHWDHAKITGASARREGGPRRLGRRGYSCMWSSLNKKVVLALNEVTLQEKPH